MDHPIFKLEKVVQPKTGETLEDFEGPLDLILFLLNKNKIEIQDIPIALILDQYLAYLEQRKQMDLEVASEFVTMAAHLMYIKTRMLLSIEDEEAQSEMDALIQSLAERQRGDAYARIRKLTERMGPMSEFGRSILTRGPEPMKRGRYTSTIRSRGIWSSPCRRCWIAGVRRRHRRCGPLTRSSSGSRIRWSGRPRSWWSG